MRVLMISIDKGLLGRGQLGDVVERHKKYGDFCEQLDIVVLDKECHSEKRSNKESNRCIKLSDNVTSYSTNSKTKLFYYFNALKLGKKLFKQTQYDLIVCQDPFLTGLIGLKLKKKYGAKLLIHFHGDYKFPFWFVVKAADGIRVMSNGQKEKLIKKGIVKEKIYVISTPIDVEKFLSFGCHSHESENPESREKTVLYVGRLEKVKNLELLLNTFKLLITNHQLPITLEIIGTGNEENNLKKLAKKLNISNQVKFLGKLLQNKIIEHYYNSNIVVLPSKSESFGKVLVEAGACGKPVVATMTTGAKEIVQDGITGFLVPIGDEKALAGRILELLNNGGLAKKMGAQAREFVKQNFDGNIQLQKIRDMWYDIISQVQI